MTFETDMFHPLITPLSTLTYTTDIHDSGTVSATDEERLPPGGFSLRHGFPAWFGRARRSAANNRQTSAQHPSTGGLSSEPEDASIGGREVPLSIYPQVPKIEIELRDPRVSTFEVLRYIRSTFDDAAVLDSVPLEAAGNTGAWHAWRTYRLNSGIKFSAEEPLGQDIHQINDNLAGPTSDENRNSTTELSKVTPRKPGEWNWDGVWEVRSRKGIDATLAEPTLFGNAAASDDLVRIILAILNGSYGLPFL